MRVRDFRTVDGSRLIKAVENEHGNTLSHGTYKWIKVSISAIFTHAKNEGVYDGINPMTGVHNPKGKRPGRTRAILRHEDVSATQKSYIKTVPNVVTNATKQLEARIARAADVQQVSVNRSASS
jgi:hypothetical protein